MTPDDAARFEPDPCYCGQPATQPVGVGSHPVGGALACAWCGDPAAVQRYVGSGRRGNRWRRFYSWLCGPCARDADIEREESIRD